MEAVVPNGGSEERLCIDEALAKYAGEFGPWQARQFFLVSLAWLLDAFHTMVTIFADRVPAWRCVRQGGCGGRGICELERGAWEWEGGRGVSTVAQWGLVCGQKYKIGLVQSAFFAGCMLGCGIFGHLSDSFLGRKGALMAGCIINTILGCLTSLSPSYSIYLLLRTLTGLCTGPMGTTAFLLATEPIGPSRRAAAGISVFYFFSAGIILIAVLAASLPSSWRLLYFSSSLPTLAFVLLILPFLSESPRWYLIRRNPAASLRILRSIAKSNSRSDIPDNVSLTLDCSTDPNSDDAQTSASIIDVLRSRVTRPRLILSVVTSFFCSVVYYGLTLNAANLGTNIYASVIINSVSELPAFTIAAFLIGRFGRRRLTVGTMWLSGGFCVAGAAVRGGVVRMGCGVMGIFGIAATYNLLLVYTAELFPTTVRNTALGCVQQAEQIGAVLAPMVVVMGGKVTFLVFGVCGLVGGMLGLYLPETLDQPLYDTLAGMEDGEKARAI
ncbi:organic cation/carnitine transporter 4-like isoform X2 [Phalaenopsis equestris]|uniref:organic cation/carnitine transporter 4-like isoform X1 n=1 Tax=Phalaenopsis equestris TaxID=78828 RepID=UPI0009E4DA22|nr:organic cation/carnitine transporter 4-like isoform X1 [Phalaenopsis equestris]XP_020591828.1 organic cation/carnitine transporter 4-like isoform X2 [Phalaenopsis equestris]